MSRIEPVNQFVSETARRVRKRASHLAQQPRASDKPTRGFMDGIDYEEHLKNDGFGTRVYPSEAACRRNNRCIKEGGCGVVEVEVRLVRWVEEQHLSYHEHKDHGY